MVRLSDVLKRVYVFRSFEVKNISPQDVRAIVRGSLYGVRRRSML